MAELLLGCGNHREKVLSHPDKPGWTALTTLDHDPNCNPDVEWDLTRPLKLPFDDESFDELHAYHVLEHLGALGDFKTFFAQWSDYWRVLKPGGIFFAIVPAVGSPWMFGDPGHSRVIAPETLTFLDQTEYTKQVGKTALADYRRWYTADFTLIHSEVREDQFCFALTAMKPSRISR